MINSNNVFIIIFSYIAFMNFIAIIVNLYDKYASKHNKWRISERALWLIALLGGAPLTFVTMQAIRHKTQKKLFKVFMPILACCQLLLLFYLFAKV